MPLESVRRPETVIGDLDQLVQRSRRLRRQVPVATQVVIFARISGSGRVSPDRTKSQGASAALKAGSTAWNSQTPSLDTPAGSTRYRPLYRGPRLLAAAMPNEAPSPPQSSVADLMRASIQAWSRDRTETEEPLLFGRSPQSHAKCSPAREWGAGFRALDRETLRASMSGWGLSVCNDGG